MSKRVAEYYQAKAERYCRREGNDVSEVWLTWRGRIVNTCMICALSEYFSFNRLTMAPDQRILAEWGGAAQVRPSTITSVLKTA